MELWIEKVRWKWRADLRSVLLLQINPVSNVASSLTLRTCRRSPSTLLSAMWMLQAMQEGAPLLPNWVRPQARPFWKTSTQRAAPVGALGHAKLSPAALAQPAGYTCQPAAQLLSPSLWEDSGCTVYSGRLYIFPYPGMALHKWEPITKHSCLEHPLLTVFYLSLSFICFKPVIFGPSWNSQLPLGPKLRFLWASWEQLPSLTFSLVTGIWISV